jgi:hypothetical protein
VVDAAISESVFNMLESCVAEAAMAGHNRPPSGSTISGEQPGCLQRLTSKEGAREGGGRGGGGQGV